MRTFVGEIDLAALKAAKMPTITRGNCKCGRWLMIPLISHSAFAPFTCDQCGQAYFTEFTEDKPEIVRLYTAPKCTECNGVGTIQKSYLSTDEICPRCSGAGALTAEFDII
jgi:hypothetical protein